MGFDKKRQMRPTNKSAEQLAHERELKLKNRMLKAYLKDNAIGEAMRFLQELLTDPHCPKRTRASAAKSLLANASKLMPQLKVEVDSRSVNLSMADVLKLAASAGSDSRLSQPEIKQGLPASSESASDAGSSSALGSGEDAEETPAYLTGAPAPNIDEVDTLLDELQEEPREGAPLPSYPQAPGAASRSDERKEDPTEGAGDTRA